MKLRSLKTIANYAKLMGCSTPYIYKLEKQDKLKTIKIDGIKFINIEDYPVIN